MVGLVAAGLSQLIVGSAATRQPSIVSLWMSPFGARSATNYCYFSPYGCRVIWPFALNELNRVIPCRGRWDTVQLKAFLSQSRMPRLTRLLQTNPVSEKH